MSDELIVALFFAIGLVIVCLICRRQQTIISEYQNLFKKKDKYIELLETQLNITTDTQGNLKIENDRIIN